MNKLSITSLAFLLSLPIYAAPVQFGRIVDIKGSGFISFEGQTHEIKKGEVVNVNSEIIVESSGQVTFTDNADHRFFLGNSTSVAVSAGKVELRSGDMWMQSLNKMDDYKLTSANAVVNYQGGEAIFSYDSIKGKTQLMVINGLMKFSNLRSPELNLTVSEGNFSFVDPGFEEGMPRDPTPVGEKSYKELVATFPGVSPMDKHSAEIFKDSYKANERKIASVPETHGAPVVVETKKTVTELEKEYKNAVMKLKKESHAAASATTTKTVTQKSNKMVVKIYGLNGSDTSATTAIYDIPVAVNLKGRAPASVPVADSDTVDGTAVPKAENMNTIPNSPQYKESVKLIDQLNKL